MKVNLRHQLNDPLLKGVEILSIGTELLLGNMDQTAIDALAGANGMIVYNTSTNKFQGYENGAWANLI